MTALDQYQRLEGTGVWRAGPDAQRQDVIVAMGDAALTISDGRGVALTHWSLPAIERINPGKRPALFRPGADAPESLEIDDETLIEAINRVQGALARRRPRPGRLRLWILGTLVGVVVLLAVFWLPGAMLRYTARVVPEPVRGEIGAALVDEFERLGGPACDGAAGRRALALMAGRLFAGDAPRVEVLRSGVGTTVHLPGGIVVMASALVEDYEDPDVPAGFLLAEALRAEAEDPLLHLLRAVGLPSALRLLTTGHMAPAVLRDYASALLVEERADVPPDRLLARFAAAGISSRPYAYALDISGEATVALIEADPAAGGSGAPILSDDDWVSLQGICGQ